MVRECRHHSTYCPQAYNHRFPDSKPIAIIRIRNIFRDAIGWVNINIAVNVVTTAESIDKLSFFVAESKQYTFIRPIFFGWDIKGAVSIPGVGQNVCIIFK